MNPPSTHADLSDLPALYRAAAIRRIEAAVTTQPAPDGSRVDEDMLMARAGRAAWRLLLERWSDAQRIGIVCGPGNNGGDGYVLAELARSSGRRVHVLRLSERVREGAARRAAETYLGNGGRVSDFAPGDALPDVEVWVDALFGIGLQRAPEGAAAALIDALNAQSAPVLAIDVPSGIDADSGDAPGAAVAAQVTLTFIAGKCGLYTGRGRVAAGEVRVDAIGVGPAAFVGVDADARLARANALGRWLRPRARGAHKGDFGHVLCIGGDHGYGGAIALCAEAALRSGAGLVSVATRAAHAPMLLMRRPECMARAVETADDLAPLFERATALAIGPGLGRGDWSRAMLDAALAVARERDLPLVLDADALNLLDAGLDANARRLPPRTVLTPHPGEASRLLDATVSEIERDRIASAQRLARRYAATVVWKGAGTVVVAPEAAAVVIDAGNPGMASGGMGDVLTGTIAALLAQRIGGAVCGAHDAAICGALLHATAGDAAAREGGERGSIASDVLAQLRRYANPAVRA